MFLAGITVAFAGIAPLIWQTIWTDYFIWSSTKHLGVGIQERAIEQIEAGGWRRCYRFVVLCQSLGCVILGCGLAVAGLLQM
jgi:hypothetical protein